MQQFTFLMKPVPRGLLPEIVPFMCLGYFCKLLSVYIMLCIVIIYEPLKRKPTAVVDPDGVQGVRSNPLLAVCF